jgi:hypothetical protein
MLGVIVLIVTFCFIFTWNVNLLNAIMLNG